MIEHLFTIIAFLLSTTFPRSDCGVVVTLIAPQARAEASEVIITGNSPTMLTQPVVTATGGQPFQPLRPQGRRAATVIRMRYVYTGTPFSFSDQMGVAKHPDSTATNISVKNALENRLYFSTIPHEKLLLKMERIREENGLPRHLLESIRPFHPFYVQY